jgi:hypothetical protein
MAGTKMSELPAHLLFDRRAGVQLVGALKPSGALHQFVDLVRDQDHSAALDLQFRANPNTGESAATLYVGLTKAIDLKVNGTGSMFCAALQPKFGPASATDWRPPVWAQWTPIETMGEVADSLLAFTKATIEDAPKSHIASEGGMQAILSNTASEDFVVIDRESQFHFPSTEIKKAVLREEGAEIAQALAAIFNRGEPWAREKSFGGELDALAMDKDGRLLIIEVKPGWETGPLGRTPGQVGLYRRLFARWTAQDPALAREVLEGMLDQRAEAGLLSRSAWGLADPIDLSPVIAVGGIVGNADVANKRMLELQAELDAAPGHWPTPAVWQFSPPDDIQKVELGKLT